MMLWKESIYSWEISSSKGCENISACMPSMKRKSEFHTTQRKRGLRIPCGEPFGK